MFDKSAKGRLAATQAEKDKAKKLLDEEGLEEVAEGTVAAAVGTA